MINTKLTIALEELFKKEPFNLENTTISIRASYGSIEINPDEDRIQELEDSNYNLSEENDRLTEKQENIDEEINYYRSLLDDNNIDYHVY